MCRSDTQQALRSRTQPDRLAPLVYVGEKGPPQSICDVVPELRTARTFPHWGDFVSSCEDLSEGAVVICTAGELAGVKDWPAGSPAKGLVLLGRRDAFQALDHLQPDLFMPPSPCRADVLCLHALRRRVAHAAHRSEVLRYTRTVAGSVVAEIQGAVTAVIAYGELLLSQVPPAFHQELERLLQGAAVIEDLLERLHELMGQEPLHGVVRFRTVEVVPALRRAIETVQAAFRKKELRLLSDCEPQLPLLWADQEAVCRIFTSLLWNAAARCPPGGTVLCTIRRNNDWVQGVITHAGPPFLGEELGRLFLPAADCAEKDQLSAAWESVSLHQGLLWAENSPQGKPQFTVLLPSASRAFSLLHTPCGSVVAQRTSSGVTVTFSGSIGAESSAQLRCALAAVTQDVGSVSLDLSRCHHLASAVVAVLVEFLLDGKATWSFAAVSPELEPILQAARLLETAQEHALRRL